MMPFRQNPRASFYLLSLLNELKLELELELKLELESELPLLSVSDLTGADAYEMSADHKGDT